MKKQRATNLSVTEQAEAIFQEAFRKGPFKSFTPKSALLNQLKEYEVYSEFLKLCMEFDMSDDLERFRQGLFLVVKAVGPGLVAKESGVNRVTLYRMLAKGGNPGLKNLMSVLYVLRIKLWIATREFQFAHDRAKSNRPKKYRNKRVGF